MVDTETTFDDDEICNAAGIVLLQRPNETDVDEIKGERLLFNEGNDKLDFEYSISPNLANTELVISIHKGVNQIEKLYAYNLLGQKVVSKSLNIDYEELRLDVNSWNEGVYWFELVLKDGSKKVQKISIVH